MQPSVPRRATAKVTCRDLGTEADVSVWFRPLYGRSEISGADESLNGSRPGSLSPPPPRKGLVESPVTSGLFQRATSTCGAARR